MRRHSLLTRVSTPTALPWLLIAVGVGLRIVRYLHNRALWGDEAALALNLVNRSPRELLDPLSFDQASPTLFLLAEKGAIGALGETEYALRALPLLAGIASLPLFWNLARRVLEPAGARFALAFFAVGDPLVFYSTEVKQYGIDVVVTLLMLTLLLPVLSRNPLSTRRSILMSLTGAVAVWLSHPSVFVLAALGVVLVLRAIQHDDRAKLRSAVLVSLIWAVSFLSSYVFALPNTRTVTDELRLAGAAGGAGGHAQEVPQQVLGATWDSFAYPLGVAATSTGLAALALIAGLLGLSRRNPVVAATLASPGVLAFGAAVFDRYPWGDRFVLFLVPLVILLVSAGLDELRTLLWKRMRVVWIAAVCLILAYPVAVSAGGIVHPPEIKRQEIKQPLAFLGENWQEGDTLYVHEIAQYALRYYSECGECGVLVGWEARLRRWGALPEIGGQADGASERPALRSRPPHLFVGSGLRPSFVQLRDQLAPLRGRGRVWLLFSTRVNEDFLLYLLDGWGQRLAVVPGTEAALYLYDLRDAPAGAGQVFP